MVAVMGWIIENTVVTVFGTCLNVQKLCIWNRVYVLFMILSINRNCCLKAALALWSS